MKLIEFTPEEAQAVVQLFNIAVKSEGLGVAEAAATLTRKFHQAFGEQAEPEGVETSEFADSVEPPSEDSE